ncbi:hypothetical protein [Methylobacterium aquaticum]|uniref:Uncharacterized protein n=1 Tax=Methylobacterium aquaticum TaxID=270351 RepID=A0A0C6FP28_9HYPH|nr:hypothetical protein [Methylobacterium aquaticum]BAQ44370.1 hypothetical protein Maq22A_c04820 [Methylobacterium aquaticum]
MAKPMKDEGGKGVSAETLETLVRECASIKSKMDTARGELGSTIKDAEETHGINRPAFKLAMKLKGQETDKRRDFMRSFKDYCEKLGLNSQLDMFEQDDDAPEAEAAAADQGEAAGKANAKRVRSGIKPLEGVH